MVTEATHTHESERTMYTSTEILELADTADQVIWTVAYAAKIARNHGADLADADADFPFTIAPGATTVVAADLLNWLGY